MADDVASDAFERAFAALDRPQDSLATLLQRLRPAVRAVRDD
jgi:DNA-directed RNA polymerase specialized sigma24 family protein